MSPKRTEECVKSVLDDNPEYSESRAYAICVAAENRNELEVSDDPSHDELLTAAAQQEIDCPEGHVHTGSQCVPIEEVRDVPPSLLGDGTVFQLAGLATEPIERTEEGEDTVRYSNLSFLTEGVWTDQKSKTPTLYSEEGIANIQARFDESEFDGPPVNVMHDVDPASGEVHEASHGGYVDPNSLKFSDGALMGDIVLDTSTAAGDFADENLQSALESNGRVGFGGPSVELDLDPESHIQNSDHPSAEKEISGGYLTGLGLVMEPADKNVAFDRETRERAVAMSSQTDKAVYAKRLSMDQRTELRNELLGRELNVDAIEDEAAAIAEEYEGVSAEDVLEMLAPLMDMDDDAEGDGEGEAEEEPPDAENEDGEDDEEEEEDAEMQSPEELNEEIEALWEEVDELRDAMMGEEQLSESLAEAKEELADADTVAELEEAKEELDKRLSDLEEEPESPRSLAEGKGEEWDPVYDDTPAEQSSW